MGSSRQLHTRTIGLLQPSHLLVILVVALFFFGPKRTPRVGEGLGRGNPRIQGTFKARRLGEAPEGLIGVFREARRAQGAAVKRNGTMPQPVAHSSASDWLLSPSITRISRTRP